MPTPMFPLYGTSVSQDPPVAATAAEIEEFLDSSPLLAEAMTRAPKVEPEAAPGASPDPGPARTLENEYKPPAPQPPGMR